MNGKSLLPTWNNTNSYDQLHQAGASPVQNIVSMRTATQVQHYLLNLQADEIELYIEKAEYFHSIMALLL